LSATQVSGDSFPRTRIPGRLASDVPPSNHALSYVFGVTEKRDLHGKGEGEGACISR
jgi:hypothetical protein